MLSFKQYLKEEKSGHKFHGNQYLNVLSAHFKKFDNQNITPKDILSNFEPELADEIASKIKEVNALTPTIDEYSQDKDGHKVWDKEREKLHNEIINSFLTPEAIERATPKDGKPTFIILGGRGGSGKSAFTNGKLKEFDAENFIVLDSDEIKKRLKPPYQGWNAAQVHAESSYVFDVITSLMKNRGLNFIHDSTLKTKGVERVIMEMKKSGYEIQGHYMHVPREVSATRAVKRYLGNGPNDRKRLVPIEVILDNTENEKNFDSMKKHFDKWSAWDNQVPKGELPKLISRKK